MLQSIDSESLSNKVSSVDKWISLGRENRIDLIFIFNGLFHFEEITVGSGCTIECVQVCMPVCIITEAIGKHSVSCSFTLHSLPLKQGFSLNM